MSAVTKYFFTPIYTPSGALEVVSWWEKRRPLFNAAVGSAGLLSIATATVLGMLPPHPSHFSVPLIAIGIYAAAANACYTLGPAVDLFIRRRWGNSYAAVGPVMFRYGFVFSVGLTLLPIPLSVLGWVFRLLGVGP